jgi:hypothetical protein
MLEDFDFIEREDVIAFDQIQDKDAKIVTEMLDALKIQYLSRPDDLIGCLVAQLRINDKPKSILKEGVPCRIITPRKQGWIKGKIKLSLQFIPDENDDLQISIPTSFENPLDEIRNTSTEYS